MQVLAFAAAVTLFVSRFLLIGPLSIEVRIVIPPKPDIVGFRKQRLKSTDPHLGSPIRNSISSLHTELASLLGPSHQLLGACPESSLIWMGQMSKYN